MTEREKTDRLTEENLAGWNASVVGMLAMRKGRSIAGLPLLYRDLGSRTGGPVLLLCSGLGVRAIQFARAGFEVTCVDLSEQMLAHARHLLEDEAEEVRRRVDLRRADVRARSGHEKYGLVILEDWDFAQLLTQADQLACLAAIKAALRPEGLAVIDVFSPYYKMKRDHVITGEAAVSDSRSPDGARLNRRTTRSEFDDLTQIETMHVLFEVFEGDKKTSEHRCTWRLRHTGLWEFELLLTVSGLRPIVRCPDFDFERTLAEQQPFDHATDDFAFILARDEASVSADGSRLPVAGGPAKGAVKQRGGGDRREECAPADADKACP